MSGKRYSVEISDPEIRDALESSNNRSEKIRDSLRQMLKEQNAQRMTDLTEPQKAGYQWLRQQDGFVPIDEANTAVAVRAQLDKQIVRRTVWHTLKNLGLVQLDQRLWYVGLKSRPPAECPHCNSVVPPANLGSHIKESHPEEIIE